MALAAARTAVLVDTHPLSLDSVRRVVLDLGIEVSAGGIRIDRVAELVAHHDPDLLVLGVDALDAQVQQLLRAVQSTHRKLRIVVISDDDLRSAQMALVAGADAYCGRTASTHDLAAAIRQSFERSIHLRPLPVDAATSQTEGYAKWPYLTPREAEILRFVAAGRTNKQIARTLWVSLHTVKFHLSNIYRKLSVANRAEAAHWAEQRGLHESGSRAGTNGG
jgi:two-component system, NarL family, nitrate/nitrite response regulator NarL